MSGGHYNYSQMHLGNIADQLKEDIATESKPRKSDYCDDIYPPMPKDILKTFRETYEALIITEQLVQRIDWLMSADDGEDSFRERLVEELTELSDTRVTTKVGLSLIKGILKPYLKDTKT